MSSPGQRRDECAPDQQPVRDGSVVREIAICNRKGLHARASAKFVQTVEKYDADVRVMRCGEVVGGTSIMGLMMLAAASGTKITVEAIGPQAADVVDALAALIESRFGEDD
jgi:phosphocarrier protein